MTTRRRFTTQSLLALGATLPSLQSKVPANAQPRRRLKIGQIGVCHEHAEGRMASLLKMADEVEVVGVVDDRDSKAARFAGTNLRAFQGLPWLTEAELFAIEDLDAVLVETANEDLVPTALRCMERGLSISMDKPGGFNEADFVKLRLGMESRGLVFQMGYMFRTNPGILWLQSAVEKGLLGEIYEIEASMSHDYGNARYRDYLGQLPGGIMFNLGCHHLDWITSLLGRPDCVLPILSRTKDAPASVINLARVVLQYPNAIATVHACDAEVGGSDARYLRVSGSKGSFSMRPIERLDGGSFFGIWQETPSKGERLTKQLPFEPMKDRYLAQHQDFVAQVRGGKASRYSAKHDILSHQVHLAASGMIEWPPH